MAVKHIQCVDEKQKEKTSQGKRMKVWWNTKLSRKYEADHTDAPCHGKEGSHLGKKEDFNNKTEYNLGKKLK